MSTNQPRFGERAPENSSVCYRHADRPSFVLCQRCGRTICPDCQTQSSVGVLCANCVKELSPSRGQQAARAARTATRKARGTDAPVVTLAIIVLCVIVYMGQAFVGQSVTAALWYAPAYSMPATFEPWRELTVMFTHSPTSIVHLLFNMFALWFFGRNLEVMLGRARYILLYVLAGWGGSMAVQLWAYVDPQTLLTPTVGASGAIFGVFGATFVALKRLGANITSLAVLLAINLGVGFLPGSNVSWQAHIGGLLIGALTMWIMMHPKALRSMATTTLWVGIIALVLLALSFSFFVVSPV